MLITKVTVHRLTIIYRSMQLWNVPCYNFGSPTPGEAKVDWEAGRRGGGGPEVRALSFHAVSRSKLWGPFLESPEKPFVKLPTACFGEPNI